MSLTINLGAWSSVFAVPSAVVDSGLKFSDGVKLKVLLFVLRNAGNVIDDADISAGTGVNVTDIPEALEYWVSMGILEKNGSEFFPKAKTEENSDVAQNSSKKENKTAAKPAEPTVDAIKDSVEESKKHFTVTKPQKPDYVYTSQRLVADEELKFLVSETQTVLGKVISNSDVSTLLMLKDTCGLPLDVILMLIQYCLSIGKGNMRTIEKVGIGWADDGIDTVEAAENKIRLSRQKSRNYSVVAAAFGINNAGSPTKKQLDYCQTWVGEWNMTPELLREAYERCVDSKGSMKFNYIDGILKRWYASGIRTTEQLKEHEAAAQAQKKSAGPTKSGTSYNIDELEKIDTLDFID